MKVSEAECLFLVFPVNKTHSIPAQSCSTWLSSSYCRTAFLRIKHLSLIQDQSRAYMNTHVRLKTSPSSVQSRVNGKDLILYKQCVCPLSLSLSLSLVPFHILYHFFYPLPPSVSHSHMLPPLNKKILKNHSSSPPSAIGQLCFHSNRLKDLNPPAHTESVVAGAFEPVGVWCCNGAAHASETKPMGARYHNTS